MDENQLNEFIAAETAVMESQVAAIFEEMNNAFKEGEQ